MARTDSASTSALMRMYQTAIAQHQRASTSSLGEQLAGGEEIEVIAKAGQGAFGSVYVAMWRGLVVAVKVGGQRRGHRTGACTGWDTIAGAMLLACFLPAPCMQTLLARRNSASHMHVCPSCRR